MGIVLKRRDNANIVKIVCGNIIDQILNKQSIEGAVKKTQELLTKIITGKIPLDKFIITKTLKTTYKDRTRIVHAVLADRMGDRDLEINPNQMTVFHMHILRQEIKLLIFKVIELNIGITL